MYEGEEEKGAIRFGNKQVRVGRAQRRQIRRRFPERAGRDQGLQRRTAEEMQKRRDKEVRRAEGDRKSSEKSMKEQVWI